MYALKHDRPVIDSSSRSILMSQWIAQTIRDLKDNLPFGDYFTGETLLVPVPKSVLMQTDTLWVPQRITNAMMALGLAVRTASCLTRVAAVPKSASSSPENRPKPIVHYDSLEVQGNLTPTSEILIVDDVITRGATICGAANRLIEAFPDARIRAFAAMRTVSNPSEFQNPWQPTTGIIRYRETQQDTMRNP
jgi:predicted amidophosphoribosyltransferase